MDYVRSVGEVRGYYPLTKDLTLVGRALAGNIFNWNQGGLIRTVDDFYKGGECVRGFAPAGLGPRDPSSQDALGGKNFYCATAEVRFPIPFIPEDMGFGGAVFADAGSVWGTDANALAKAYLAKNPSLPSSLYNPAEELLVDPCICRRQLDLELANRPAACRLRLRSPEGAVRPNAGLPLRCGDQVLSSSSLRLLGKMETFKGMLSGQKPA